MGLESTIYANRAMLEIDLANVRSSFNELTTLSSRSCNPEEPVSVDSSNVSASAYIV